MARRMAAGAGWGGWRPGNEGLPAGGYEIRPIDGRWELNGWCGHAAISLLSA